MLNSPGLVPRACQIKFQSKIMFEFVNPHTT